MSDLKTSNKLTFTRKLTFTAILTALQIILSRWLGIQTELFQISFGFVPIAFSAMLLGPVWASLTALLADFVGTMIAGTGAYNPMFSINAVLYALIFAWFLYKKEKTAVRIVLCVAAQLVLVAIPLTPLWLYIYFKYIIGSEKAFMLIFTTKLMASFVEAAIKIAVLIPLCRLLYPRLEKAFKLKN